ncbi:MAG: ATP-binding cassette domain-containing protein [Proteobacteria bacterium]|nr:ATP-binding cassette domain-containing protein [Pseudomonadota bacterium]MDA0992041.1 ATP-binding cassette domain-containing protein [Pseudomonadota bacterium]
MLNLRQISIRRGRKLLVRNVTFQAHAGQRVGVIGANGSGKTSLFALLLGELEADDGELGIDPNDVFAHVAQESPNSSSPAVDYVIDGDIELRKTEAAIEKGEASATRNDKKLHELYEKMEAIDGFTAESRAAKLINGLGFSTDDLRKPVREFSGGWRMRLNLARALMCRSDILLLDEPTNHLDLPAILWLERWLKRYEGILLVISHDRDFLDEVCTRIGHIENNEMNFYSGNYSQFEAQRAEHLAQQQAMFTRQQKDIKHIQGFVDRFRYKASKARQAQSRLKMLERMTLIAPAHADSPFHFHFAKPKKQPQHLLGLTDAALGYADNGEEIVLDNVTVNLMAGDRVGLLGVNGAGKSTLVKALASGSTLLSGERLLSKDTKIGYFAQHQLDLLTPDQSPLDHLRLYAPDDRESDMRNYLGRFDFSGERIFEPVAPFSGGEKARLVLALMIRQAPNLLLLDEPTNHLDLEMRQALSIALIEYTGALVVISHDRHLLRSVCDELLIVHDGIVDRFSRSLDDYPAWLKEQQDLQSAAAAETVDHEKQKPLVNKKQLRQEEAQRRQRLKPLTDKVREIDRQLETRRHALQTTENSLSDETIYTDPERRDELTDLIKEQSSLKTAIDALEWDWIEASEALENAN